MIFDPIIIKKGGSLPDNLHTITVTAEPPDGGNVFGGGIASKDMQITINALPANGFKFTEWVDENSNGSLSQQAEYSFKVLKNEALKAVFLEKLFDVFEIDTTVGTANTSVYIEQIGFINGIYVVVSYSGYVRYTSDFVNFTGANLPSNISNINRIYAFPNVIFGVSNAEPTKVLMTQDGKNWSISALSFPERNYNYAQLNRFIYKYSDRYVAVYADVYGSSYDAKLTLASGANYVTLDALTTYTALYAHTALMNTTNISDAYPIISSGGQVYIILYDQNQSKIRYFYKTSASSTTYSTYYSDSGVGVYLSASGLRWMGPCADNSSSVYIAAHSYVFIFNSSTVLSYSAPSVISAILFVTNYNYYVVCFDTYFVIIDNLDSIGSSENKKYMYTSLIGSLAPSSNLLLTSASITENNMLFLTISADGVKTSYLIALTEKE